MAHDPPTHSFTPRPPPRALFPVLALLVSVGVLVGPPASAAAAQEGAGDVAAAPTAPTATPADRAAPAAASAAHHQGEAATPRGQEDLSVQRIFGTSELSPEGFSGAWRQDGDGWTVVESDDQGRDELWQVEAATGQRERLIRAEELVPEGASESVSIYDWSFSPDGRRVLIFADAQRVWRARTKGTYYTFDLTSRELRPVSEKPGWQMFAKFGPRSEQVAFVREHDLFVTDIASGRERRLTSTGSPDTINGTTDWVYEEELGLRDAFRWSPDGRRIAYWQLDQGPIPPFYLLDETQLYPELKPVRYPKAGTENSRVRVGSLELETGETTWLDVGGPEYIPRMDWVSDRELAVQTLNRHQNRLEVRIGDARSGGSRVVLMEADSAWVDVDDDLTWIRGGEQFVWSSDRDGWNHLYLFARDGSRVRQLTRGEWPVTSFYGVDEERGRAWFAAAVQHPYTRSVGHVPLDGGPPTWVAGPAAGEPCAPPSPEGMPPAAGPEAGGGPGGVHGAEPAPDFERLFHTCSTAALPPVTTLRRADGTRVRTLVDNAQLRARLDSLELGTPEFLQVTAADGETPLNAWMIRPSGFDPARRYPLLIYVYGGPGVQTVMDAWGGSRHLWHQLMARKGFVVASVDNRGTGARGRAFYKQTYLRLGELETADQLAAAGQLGDRPWVDADRMGIWGWSYGGYMTLLSLLKSGGTLAAGVSVAPVTDWKFYDTVYTERYMRTPEENPEGYRQGAPLTYADRLASSLFIVHGTGDDNVHPQNTVRMVQALEEADRQFRMRIYPNKRHGIAGADARVNLFEGITGFLQEELAGR